MKRIVIFFLSLFVFVIANAQGDNHSDTTYYTDAEVTEILRNITPPLPALHGR